MTMRRAIGLMSGTSLDGVDVALIETDGETVRVERSPNGYLEPLGPTGYRAYSDDDRALLRQALIDAEAVTERSERPGSPGAAEELVTRLHAEAVENFLAENGLSPADIDVVGFHGTATLMSVRVAMSIPSILCSAVVWCALLLFCLVPFPYTQTVQ